MTNMKSHTRRLVLTGVSILLCFVLLIGATLALATEIVTSTGHIVTAGTFYVDLKVKDTDSDSWTSIKEDADAAAFVCTNWEPTDATAKVLKVVNEGTIDLQWKAAIVPAATNNIPTDGSNKLTDFIDVYVKVDATEYPTITDATTFTEDDGWVNGGKLSAFETNIDTVLKEAGAEQNLIVEGDTTNPEVSFAIVLKMNADTTQEQLNSLVNQKYEFDIKILAAQTVSIAEWPDIVTVPEEPETTESETTEPETTESETTEPETTEPETTEPETTESETTEPETTESETTEPETTEPKPDEPVTPTVIITPQQMYAAGTGSTNDSSSATLADDGSYVTLTSTTTDPHFVLIDNGCAFNTQTNAYDIPVTTGNYVVIKYRVTSTVADTNSTLEGVQAEGYTIYEGGDIGTWPLWYWEADGEWNYVIVDISGFTGKKRLISVLTMQVPRMSNWMLPIMRISPPRITQLSM